MTGKIHYSLKLYVTGLSPIVRESIGELEHALTSKFGDHFDLDVIDVLVRPELAEGEKIFATPTIIRKLPEPVKKVILDLRSRERVLIGLDLIELKKEAEGMVEDLDSG
ncbi:MAG: circadian clock protein KaiB [Candidatus Aminicenantes bacterium]|nr:circadian clock protein KaiB [Candidatus Aminicenantes bacterium]NIM78239.1 circadian clock protein KaiB [Candidatus Aminicenantes bacterium]NIN23745.1 circadian clock protein KaiB [Candidatus Aminicenantes bacterium]NIN47452.1 circadian clock protein KaiB [Candidatus Aminicenantes bacterium]NIN90380.1 circadian clock protein KaiB [Candidatus Aminicenantes bacterium]